MHHLAGEGAALGLGDIGKIGDDAIEATAERGEEITFDKVRIDGIQGLAVFPGERQGVR